MEQTNIERKGIEDLKDRETIYQGQQICSIIRGKGMNFL